MNRFQQSSNVNGSRLYDPKWKKKKINPIVFTVKIWRDEEGWSAQILTKDISIRNQRSLNVVKNMLVKALVKKYRMDIQEKIEPFSEILPYEGDEPEGDVYLLKFRDHKSLCSWSKQ